MNISTTIFALLLLAAGLAYYICKVRRERQAKALDEVRNSPVIKAAALFWTTALCQDFDPKLDAEDLNNFYFALAKAIASQYMEHNLRVVQFGITSRAQMGFVSRLSADPIFQTASSALAPRHGLIRELAAHLPIVEMRINEGAIKLRPVSRGSRFHEWQEIFRVGDDENQMYAIGLQYRPEAVHSDEDLLRGAA